MEKERERLSRERCERVKETHMGEIDGLTIQWFMENNLKTIKMASILRTSMTANKLICVWLLVVFTLHVYLYLSLFIPWLILSPSLYCACMSILCFFRSCFRKTWIDVMKTSLVSGSQFGLLTSIQSIIL